ncbi:hypothetical protein WN55_05887 [Dufourea novaeangliae]|uniref:DUF4817 domain-containing protein n=1 Tax=Dufourea novaeangliae TaxID=178035 RepID=A0A154PQ07_DUFNO|nr:hypothetical protein WN55_05887 [Dufourea novaeangliae]
MVFVYGECRQILRDAVRLYAERFSERVIHLNPNANTRQLTRENGISQRSVLRILHLNKFHAFHVSLHQELHGNDFQNRVNFCAWDLQKLQSDELFLTKVLFTDEAIFTNCGQVNRHNMHYWSIENPRWLRKLDKQRPWSVNVWCGLLNGEIIGPYLLMWFQHDGCPAHYAKESRQLLQRQFPNRWIGRDGEFPWPPRSPELTPLNVFLWGTLKDDV